MIPIKVKTNTRSRTIGILDPDKKTFCKEVIGSKHLFRKFDAWATDAKYFNDVLLPNNYTIVVKDKENGKTYTATAEVMNKNGQYFHFKKKEEDDRAQIFLSRRYFQVEEPKKQTEDEKAEEFCKNYL